MPDPPGFSCPGTSLASRGGSPAWEGEGGSFQILLYSWVVLLRPELGQTFMVFRKKWGMLPQTGSACKTP